LRHWSFLLLSSFLAGWGGALSAGLNAYLPILLLALADRFTTTIDLGQPYDIISSPIGIIVLLILLPIELIADKIPGIDHASDLLHSAIRPAAAAFIMMALTDERGHFNAVLALLIGLVSGAFVHGLKATTRPVITVATGGVGNPLISMVEDVVVVIVAIVAIFWPLILIGLLPLAAWCIWMMYSRMRRGSATMRRLGGLSG
jgi:hypothetical protein